MPMDQPIDTEKLAAKADDAWSSSTLTTINDVSLRFRVMQDTEAKFHTHSTSPECFFVVSGQVTIDTENSSATLGPGQFLRVEPGTSHRAKVVGRATLLVLDQLPIRQ
jgi:mannose-6-phosphate isomerase-like protein (cupin superfamily)